MNTITIKQPGLPVPLVAPKPKLDVQDGLLVAGFCSLEVGAALIFIPAALLLAGVLLIAMALMIQKANALEINQ